MKKADSNIRFTLTKSALESTLGKYFALIVNNGTLTADGISARMQDGRPAIEDADVRLTIAALVDTIIEEVVINHNKVDLGAFTLELAVSGSVESMDGALTADNEIYIAIIPSDALRSQIAKIIPTRSTADKVDIKMETVEDLSSHQKLIRGMQEFVIAGTRLSARGEGEGLVLCTEAGEPVSPVTVLDREGHGERLYAKLPEAVPTGSYVLHLTTHGYDTPDAEPAKVTKKVTAETTPTAA